MSDFDQIRKRLSEAQTILAALGLPPNQQKLVPALTLLALCGLTPDASWHEASRSLIGVSPIMDYVNVHYDVSDRENSRESFRKSAIHYFQIEQVIFEFGSRFTPGGTLIYAGDTGQKWGSYFDEATLARLGVAIASTGAKMPDVVIYHEAKRWLVVVEAFDTVGPIDSLRRTQLEDLFAASTVPHVYVTAFHDRRAMASQAVRLAWETEIWIAEAPDHLIHFNGERFLGPYE